MEHSQQAYRRLLPPQTNWVCDRVIDIKEVKQEVADLKGAHATEIKQLKENHNQQINSMTASKKELLDKIKSYEDKLPKLEVENTSLKSELEASKDAGKKIADLEAELKKLASENAQLKKDHESLKSENSQLQKKNDAYEAEVKSLQKKLKGS